MAQYRKGRKKGTKNLVKTATGFRNQWGVEFTREEKKALEIAVNSVNRKRKKQLEQLAQLPRLNSSGDIIGTALDTVIFDKDSDFIVHQRSKSLQGFQTRGQFTRYLKSAQYAASRDWVKDRMSLYKDNYVKAVEKMLMPEGADIVQKVKSMSVTEFMRIMPTVDVLEIWYPYTEEEMVGKCEAIRAALGIPSKT